MASNVMGGAQRHPAHPCHPAPRWKGENVATTEVAEALVAHDSLQEATVYGVTVPGTDAPSPAMVSMPPPCPIPAPALPSPAGHEGRAGMAALVLRPGCRLDGPGLYQHVEQLLPPYAWPRFLRLQVMGWAAAEGCTQELWGDGGVPNPP